MQNAVKDGGRGVAADIELKSSPLRPSDRPSVAPQSSSVPSAIGSKTAQLPNKPPPEQPTSRTPDGKGGWIEGPVAEETEGAKLLKQIKKKKNDEIAQSSSNNPPNVKAAQSPMQEMFVISKKQNTVVSTPAEAAAPSGALNADVSKKFKAKPSTQLEGNVSSAISAQLPPKDRPETPVTDKSLSSEETSRKPKRSKKMSHLDMEPPTPTAGETSIADSTKSSKFSPDQKRNLNEEVKPAPITLIKENLGQLSMNRPKNASAKFPLEPTGGVLSADGKTSEALSAVDGTGEISKSGKPGAIGVKAAPDPKKMGANESAKFMNSMSIKAAADRESARFGKTASGGTKDLPVRPGKTTAR